MSDDDDDEPYVILCFTQGGRQSVVKTGLTLEEAQEHCRRNDTRGDNWFHGYGLESDWAQPDQAIRTRTGALLMYYSEFVKVGDKDAVFLHDDEGVMYVGIVANEYDRIEYLTASELRELAALLEKEQ